MVEAGRESEPPLWGEPLGGEQWALRPLWPGSWSLGTYRTSVGGIYRMSRPGGPIYPWGLH